MRKSTYLCVEPGVYIAAPFHNGAAEDYVCITVSYPFGSQYPVFEKLRDITDAEWYRLQRLQYTCWYTLRHGYSPKRNAVSFMVLCGKACSTAPGGFPTRTSGGKTGV